MSLDDFLDRVSVFIPLTDPVFSIIAPIIVLLVLLGLALAIRARHHASWLRDFSKRVRGRAKPIGETALEEITRGLARDAWLRDKWGEFREGLVARPGGEFRNALAIETLVEDDAHLASFRVWRFFGFGFGLGDRLASLCTGLGVLGTFLGLTIGLASVKSGSAAEIADNVMGLIASLETAFATSIVGVSASVLLVVVLGFARDHFARATSDFREAVDHLFPRVTSELLLEEHGGLLRAIRDDILESRVNLQEISNDLADKIGKGFSSAVESLLLPSLSEMSAAVRHQVANATETSQEGTRRFVEEAVGQISGALSGSFAAMEQSMGSFSRDFENIANAVGKVVQQASDTATQQQHALHAGQQAMVDAAERAAQSDRRLASLTDATTVVAELAEVLSRNAEAANLLQGKQAQLHQAVHGQVQVVSEAVTETAGVFAASASELQAVTRSLAPLVQQLSETLSALTRNTQHASTAIAASSQSLVDRSDHEARLVSDFREVSSAFGAAFRQADPSLQAFQQAATAIIAQQGELGTATQALNASAQALNSASGSIGENTRSFSTALKESASQVRSVQVGTTEWAASTTVEIERFSRALNELLRQTLSEYDNSLAKAVGYLQSNVHALGEIAEDFTGIGRGRDQVQPQPTVTA